MAWLYGVVPPQLSSLVNGLLDGGIGGIGKCCNHSCLGIVLWIITILAHHSLVLFLSSAPNDMTSCWDGGIPYGGQVVALGVCLMVGRGLIPLLGLLYHPDTLASSTQWGSKPNGVI